MRLCAIISEVGPSVKRATAGAVGRQIALAHRSKPAGASLTSGDYKDRCYVFGQIDDTEFSMSREHVVVSCDNTAGLASWKTEHGFKSRWVLQ